MTDKVVITGGAFATVLNQNATVANLQMANGFLTINAVLTDTGNYFQDQGFLAFGADANQLQIAGNITRSGGVFLGTGAPSCGTARPPRASSIRPTTRCGT